MKDDERIRPCRLHGKPARAQERELMIEERVYEVKLELRHRSLSDAKMRVKENKFGSDSWYVGDIGAVTRVDGLSLDAMQRVLVIGCDARGYAWGAASGQGCMQCC